MAQGEAQKPAKVLLLEAGARLAREQGSALRLDVGPVCAAAGIQETLFYSYFPDRDRYLLALLLHFLDLARADAVEVIARSPQGIARIAAAFENYWDANLGNRPMRELAIHFRADPEGSEILRQRLHAIALIAQHELKSLGWPRPAESARVASYLCVATAIAEYDARQKLPEMRQTSLDYLRAAPG